MKKLLQALMLVGISSVAGSALANDYPNKSISLIVPYSAGGVTDLAGRALAEEMSTHLGQSVVIENKTGANGTMGAIQMLSAKPDGYTISMVPIGIYRMPHITDAPYDPAEDLTYISQVAGFNYYLVVNDKSPWKTVDELVDYAQKHPDTLNYGTPGTFSSQHIAMVQLGAASDVEWTHAPYKGEADALTALMGEHIDIVVGASGAIPYIENGDMRALAFLGEERTDTLPEIPTLQEQGYDIVHTSAFGIVGPKDLPDEVADRIDDAIGQAMQSATLLNRFEALGITPLYQDRSTYHDTAMESVKKEAETMKQLEVPKE